MDDNLQVKKVPTWVLVVGFLCSIFAAPIGLLIGIYAVAKKSIAAGVIMIIISSFSCLTLANMIIRSRG